MTTSTYRYTSADLERLAARLDKLARTLSDSERRILLAVFALAGEQIPPPAAPATLRYLDKSSGTEVRLTPNPAQLLLRPHQQDSESAGNLARDLRLTPVSRARQGDDYLIVATPESESGADALAAAQRDPRVAMAAPSFHAAGSPPVFLDPAYCMVQFKEQVPEASAQGLLESLQLGIHRRHRSPGLYTLRLDGGGVHVGALAAALQALNTSLLVKFAEPAYIGKNDLESAAPVLAPASDAEAARHWNLQLVNAAAAWQYHSGAPDVIVAVIDTGVDGQHPALQHALLPRPATQSWNFAEDEAPEPDDNDGHGTFIAGLLVGNGQQEIRGICPGCALLPLKVPINSATESYARRRDAILYALAYAGARRLIINISWKTTGNVALIHDALKLAVARGAVVVCSAGNWPDAGDEPHFPSDYVCAVSVGGVGPDRLRAAYSFYGSAVDIAAPGGSGASSADGNIWSAQPGGGVRSDFGTSFSAPHVAGAAALLLSQNPALTVAQVRQLIEDHALPVADTGLGRGLLDIGAAMMASAALPMPSPIPPDGPADGLAAVNQLGADALVALFGLPAITALLLVQRRPYRQLEDLRNTLGMSESCYQRIATYAQA